MLLRVFQGPCPSFVCRMKRQENMGSARTVTRYITHGRVIRVVIVFVGIVDAVGDAPDVIGNHVAFICDDHHRVILEVKALTNASTLSSTQRARSPRTAVGTGAMAASKSKLGSAFRRWLKTWEKARSSRPHPLSSTSWRALADRASRRVTTSVKKVRWLA